MICKNNEVCNEAYEWHINDCYKYGEPICVGTSKGNELQYARIAAVYDILGRLKSEYRNED